MSFEAFNYAHKRVRSSGTREWKLWYTALSDGLVFKVIVKDNASSCYIELGGKAAFAAGDPPVQEDDNENAYFADAYEFTDEAGHLTIYVDRDDGTFAWMAAGGKYGTEACTLASPGPLMPEIAG